MKALEERIAEEGIVLPHQILKVDSFLNHQIDPDFMLQIGEEFHRLFADQPVDRVLTIEASGIAPALMTALAFHVPCVFAKKKGAANSSQDVWSASVHSYTYDRDYPITIAKPYLKKDEHVLIIDDFLANGMAARGLMEMIKQADAELSGIGICIEKGFQDGGRMLREEGVNLKSLAIIEEMTENGIRFR